MNDDTRPFPVQKSLGYRNDDGKIIRPGPSVIPWWLAEEVYRGFVLAHGPVQSLERIAERGGFSRDDVLWYLRYVKPKTYHPSKKEAQQK